MKKSMVLSLVTLVLSTGIAFAGTPFDNELSNLRKTVISMCAQLQAGQPKESQEQLLTEIDGIIQGWEKITAVYQAAPPAEYAKDPAWKNYFEEALDNFKIMRQKTMDKNYRRAMQFCGQNCGLFVKIHQASGRTTVTDEMFQMRKSVKLAVSMAKAENWTGAQETMAKCKLQMKNIKKQFVRLSAGKANPEIDKDVIQLEQIYHKLKDVMDSGNKQNVEKEMKGFFKAFGVIYLKYI